MSEEGASHVPQTVATFIERFSLYAGGALRYWEPRRAIYNIVLAAVVVGHLAVGWPASRTKLSLDVLLGLFFLAVLANVCYCAVYVVDLFVQFAGAREGWKGGRVAVLAIGTAFAAVIAHFATASILGVG